MDLSWQTITIATVVFYIAEVYGTIIGGGGFLIQPVLIMLGIPPATAIASDVTASIGGEIGAISKLHKHGHVSWQHAIWIVPGTICGGIAGSYLLNYLPANFLEKMIGVLGICMVLYMIFGKRDGLSEHPLPKHWRALALLIGLIIGTYMGVSGAGSGTLASILLVAIMGFVHLKALGTRKVFLFSAKAAAIGGYFWAGLLEVKLLIPMFFAALLGGYTGSHIALKIGNIWLKRIFIVVVSGLAIWLLLK